MKQSHLRNKIGGCYPREVYGLIFLRACAIKSVDVIRGLRNKIGGCYPRGVYGLIFLRVSYNI